MKHKTWFRLVIKAIGVACLAWGIPEFLAMSAYSIIQILDPNRFMAPLGWFGIYVSKPLLLTLCGLLLFFKPNWIVNMAIPSNRPYCPECGYDVSKASGTICPECGVVLPAQSPFFAETASAAADADRAST